MSASDVREGDRFEEIQSTGDAGAVWQVVSIDAEGGELGPRVYLFNVDDPAAMRTVHEARLLDGLHYRRPDPPEGGADGSSSHAA